MATNTAILHPNIFYFVLDASWSADNKYDFWNKNYIDVTVNNYEVKKTIYSPSPTNFSEPKTAAFTGFTTTGVWTGTSSQFNVSGVFNKGWNFYCQLNYTGKTIFSAALGIRDVNSNRIPGIVAFVDYSGNYWAAGPAETATYARRMYFTPNEIATQNNCSRAYGFSLHPNEE